MNANNKSDEKMKTEKPPFLQVQTHRSLRFILINVKSFHLNDPPNMLPGNQKRYIYGSDIVHVSYMDNQTRLKTLHTI